MRKSFVLGLLLICLSLSSCAVPPDSTGSDRPSGSTSVSDPISDSNPVTDSGEGNLASDLTFEVPHCIPFVSDGGATEDSVGNEDIRTVWQNESTLLHMYDNYVKLPYRLLPTVLEGCGRIVSSAATPREAIEKTAAIFNNESYYTKDCVILLESELYYLLYVRWGARDGSDARDLEETVVSFKSHVFDAEYRDFNRHKMGTFGKVPKGTVKRVMDYWCYDLSRGTGGDIVFLTEIEEFGVDYLYTVWYARTVYGDWGIPDEVFMCRRSTRIPGTGGTVTFGEEEILTTVLVGGDSPGYVITP